LEFKPFFRLAGDKAYLIKARIPSISDFDRFCRQITEKITIRGGLARLVRKIFQEASSLLVKKI